MRKTKTIYPNKKTVVRRTAICTALCTVIVCGFLMNKGVIPVFVEALNSKEKNCKVVIDAGHGGDDPGKVGVNNTLEKDLNLIFAKQLEKQLEDAGVTVVMTRESDAGLYSQGADNKKLEDLRARCETIKKEKPNLVVSIHQNSYTDPSVRGAQVFYYGQSVEGETAANIIQDTLNEQLDSRYARDCKANESYYILKKTAAPTVIVECGFLSCPEEESLLNTAEYQKKVVQAICDGVLLYLESKQGSVKSSTAETERESISEGQAN